MREPRPPTLSTSSARGETQANDELTELRRQLTRANARIAALESRPAEPDETCFAALDALPAQVAVLDATGRILRVNQAWRRFARSNGGSPEAGLGCSYLQICEQTQGAERPDALRVAAGLRALLGGESSGFELRYPCHAPSGERWFRLLAAPTARGGAVVMHIDVTVQYLAERALRESDARYRELFEANPLPMWVYDRETLRFLAVNAAAVAHYGYSHEEFLTKRITDIRPPEDLPALLRTLDSHSNGVDDAGIWRHLRKDGALRQVQVSSHDLVFEGRPARLVLAHDITEQIEAREALGASEAQLRAILDNEPECVKVVSCEGRLLSMNRTGLRLIEAEDAPEQVIGKSVLSLVHREDRDAFAALHARVADGGHGTLQFRIVGLRGTQRWMETHSAPMLDAEGRISGVLSITRDVTARRAAEARLRLLEASLDRINDIVMIAEAPQDPAVEPRILYTNGAFSRITGYREDEIVGRTIDLLHGPATDRAEVDRILRALRARQPVRAELASYARDGRLFWVEIDVVPILDGQGRTSHFVSIERDITERRELETQMRQSQRLEAIGQLTGGIAHDFNNLLTVIQGNAELLREQLDERPALAGLARMMESASQRGAELTHRLLAFARRQALEPEVVELDALLQDLRELLQRSLGEHIEIELQHAGGPHPTLIDPAQLESAILNLCLNARDAMPAGGRLVLATQRIRFGEVDPARPSDLAAGDYTALSVSDSGHGIAPEVLSRVFEPFFTTKEQGKGSGLGLAMVYGFVKQSRGHVAIESAPGHGTRVSLYLPRGTQAASARAPEDAPAPAPGCGARILLVEDDELVRQYAQNQLEALGYRLEVAPDGAAALQILRSDAEFDLLFTDVVMPGGMNGSQLAEAARALRPGLRVLYTSGYSENALIRDGRLDPEVLLLAKPYRREELARKVRDALAS